MHPFLTMEMANIRLNTFHRSSSNVRTHFSRNKHKLLVICIQSTFSIYAMNELSIQKQNEPVKRAKTNERWFNKKQKRKKKNRLKFGFYVGLKTVTIAENTDVKRRKIKCVSEWLAIDSSRESLNLNMPPLCIHLVDCLEHEKNNKLTTHSSNGATME